MNVLSEANPSNLAAVKVFYNGHLIVPAPFIDFTQEPQFNDAGTRTSILTTLVLTGSIIIVPSGSYEQMFVKQTDLKNAFSVDNGDFVVVAGPGNKTLPENTVIWSGLRPTVNSLNIAPDTQFQRIDYTVELQDLTAASGVSGITSSLTNQWSFREDPDSCTVQVTHNVSAAGPDGEPDKFDQAQRAVQALLGIDKLPIQIPYFVEPNASGLFNLTHPSNPAGGPVFELSVSREEVADVSNGTYSVTEVFTIVSGAAYYFTSRTASFEEDQAGVATVTLAGTVQGLGRTISPSFGAEGGLGFYRACSGFINKVKPQLPWDASGVYIKYKEVPSASGLVLTRPTAYSIAENRCRGTISFSITYTDSPSANLPSGIASRTCSVSINEGIRVQASHAIPFRSLGPLIQDIKTTTEGTISVQCQAQATNTGDSAGDTNRAILFVQDELNRLKGVHANPANFITIRVTGLTQNLSDIELTCDATATFTFTVALGNVPDINSDISLRTL